MNAREELRGIIAKDSVLFREEGFLLASGRRSQYYYDLKLTTLSNPHALSLAARLLLDKIAPHVDAIGGLTSGADPLVVAVSLLALTEGRRLPGFFVREKPKAHGTERVIEGVVEEGMNVLVLDDVITQGNSVLKAIKGAEEKGARVVHVLILVDREEGGMKFLRDQGYNVEPIFTHTELVS
jgi:orotate phosphoribosyltransferase